MMDFQELFCIETAPMPSVVVIFGATGDLAKRKLFPALQSLYDRKLLNEQSGIIACGRRDYDDDSFRKLCGAQGDFLQYIRYCRGDNNDDSTFIKLKNMLSEADAECGDYSCNHLFYLALSSGDMLTVCRKLSEHGLLDESGTTAWRHVIFEKPFGRDLESAKALNESLHKLLSEEQIYRIDHYLGKETVQNIMMLRFANAIFEPIWRAEYIEQVEITAAESIGVELRGKYYDSAGALRDMFQNHMLQLLSLIAMEVPLSFDASDVRDEKVKLLRSIRPFDTEHLEDFIVRGQYRAARGMKCYTQEVDVPADSATETYVAAKLFIDSWRWRNVPFLLRSGKRLRNKKSEIVIKFKNIPHSIFPNIASSDLAGNLLVLQIFPREGISLSLQAKKPGPKLCIGTMKLDFDYGSLNMNSGDDAYARLLLDALLGDASLFIRSDFIEEAWKLLTPVLEKWASGNSSCEFYSAGSDGPAGAEKLTAPANWRSLEL